MINMKIVYNNIIPPHGFKAITLWPFVFVRNNCKKRFSSMDMNHENIHGEQEKEMLLLPFFLWYLAEWLVRLIQYRDKKKAYHAISFEREAYQHQWDMDYISNRKKFTWFKLIISRQ